MGSGGKSKKVFPCRVLVDSTIYGTENHTEHLVHGTVPSGSRSKFLAAYHTLSPPFCYPYAHDILSLFIPLSVTMPQENPADFLRFLETTNRKDWNCNHVDRQVSSVLSTIRNYPHWLSFDPITLISLFHSNISCRWFKFHRFSTKLLGYRVEATGQKGLNWIFYCVKISNCN